MPLAAREPQEPARTRIESRRWPEHAALAGALLLTVGWTALLLTVLLELARSVAGLVS
jgi:hypothetical protein